MYGNNNAHHCGNQMGQGRGRGMQKNENETYGGRNHGGAFGRGGFCVCTKCGEKVSHVRGVKCTTQKCPACGHTLVREELLAKKESVVHV